MKKQIAHGTAASIVYMVTTVVLSVLQLRILLHALPPEIVGLWLLFLSIGSYVLLFDLGISPTVAREISFTLAHHDLDPQQRSVNIGELLTTMRHIFRITAGSVGLLGAIAGECLIHFSGRYPNPGPVSWAWGIFCVGASLNLLGSTAFAGLFGVGNVASEKLVRSVCLLLGFCMMLLALHLHTGIVGLAIAWFIQAVLTQILAWRQLHRLLPAFSARIYQRNWKLAKRLAVPCLNMATVQLGALLILQSANILIASLLGTRAIPPYEAVSKIALTLMTLAMLIVNSSTPFLSMAHAAGDVVKFRALLLYNLRFGLAIMIVFCAFVAVNADRILALWLGPQAFAGFAVIWTLLLTSLLEVHHVIFATAVLATGRIAFIYAALIAGALNVALAILLAPRFGLLGIAMALAGAQLLTNNWYAPYLAMKQFHLTLPVISREVWLPMTALLVLQIAITLSLRHVPWLASNHLFALAISLVISLASGAAIASVLILNRAERRSILDLLPQRLTNLI